MGDLTRRKFINLAALSSVFSSGSVLASDSETEGISLVLARSQNLGQESYFETVSDELGSVKKGLENGFDAETEVSIRKAGTTVSTSWSLDETDFIEDSLRTLHEDGDIESGDRVLIVHDQPNYGYGSAHTETVEGDVLHGAVVYSGSLVSEHETRIFTWHEVGHSLGAHHRHGCYDLFFDFENFVIRIGGITPMAAGYVDDITGENDTVYPSSGYRGFDRFECGLPQNPGYAYHSDEDSHVFSYSDAALEAMERELR